MIGSTIPEVYLTDFPTPIVRMLEKIGQKDLEPLSKLQYTHRAVYQLLRTVSLPLMSQIMLRGGAIPEELNQRIQTFRRAIQRLRTPHFSDWIAFLFTLHKDENGKKAGIDFMPEIYDALSHIKQRKVDVPPRYAMEHGKNITANLLEAFLGLRNADAHGGVDEADLPLFVGYLAELLQVFDFLREYEIVERTADITENLYGEYETQIRVWRGKEPEPPSQYTLSSEDEVAEFERYPILMRRRKDGVKMPLYPFFISFPQDKQAFEEVSLYDGIYFHKDQSAIYYSSSRRLLIRKDKTRAISDPPFIKSEEEIERTLSRMQRLFEQGGISFTLARENVTPWGLYQILRLRSEDTLEAMRGRRYFPEVYHPRTAIEEAIWDFLWQSESSKRAFLIVAPAGSGKSALLAHLAERILQKSKESPLFLFIQGSVLTASQTNLANPLFQAILNDLNISTGDNGFVSLEDLLKKLERDASKDIEAPQGRRFILFIDALNEAENAWERVKDLVHLIREARPFKQVGMVVSIREEYLWAKLHSLEITEASPFEDIRHLLAAPERDLHEDYWIEWVPGWRLPPFSLAEAEAAYQRYHQQTPTAPTWQNLSPAQRKILQHPLHLYLWFELAKQKKSLHIHRIHELYEHYIENELRRFPALRVFIDKVAAYILKVGRSHLTESDAQQIDADPFIKSGEKLIASGFFIKQATIEGSLYVSRYERLLEVLLAYYLERNTQPLTPEAVKKWFDLPAFAELIEALGLLAEKFWLEGASEQLVPYLATETGQKALERAIEHLLLQEFDEPEGVFLALAKEGKPEALFDSWSGAYSEAQNYVASSVLEPWLHAVEKAGIVEKLPPARQAVFYGYLRSFYNRTGSAGKAIEAAERAFSLREALHQRNPQHTGFANGLASACNNLALLYEKQGRISDAEGLYQRAISLWEALYQRNPQHTGFADGLARACNNLALLYEKQGRVSEAEGLYQRAIALRETLHRRDPQHTGFANGLAMACNNLALLYEKQGRVSEAEGLYQRAISLWEALHQRNPQHTGFADGLARACNNVAGLYKDQGRVSEAEELYQRAIALREALHQRDPQHTGFANGLASACNNLSGLYENQGRVSEAEGLYLRAISLWETLHQRNPQHTGFADGLARACNNLALLYEKQGRVSEAEGLYQRAIALREALHQRDPQHTGFANGLAMAYNNLALLYEKQGRVSEAEELYQRAIALRETLHQRDPQHTGFADGLARACNNLAGLYEKQGRVSEAEGLYQRAIALREALHQRDPQHTGFANGLAMAYNNLALLYAKQGRVSEVEGLYQRAIALREALHQRDPQHTGIADGLAMSYGNLASFYQRQGRPEAAIPLRVKEVALREAVYQRQPTFYEVARNLADAYHLLARAYQLTGRGEAAEIEYMRALQLRESLLTQHSKRPELREDLTSTLLRLGEVYEMRNESERAMSFYERAATLWGASPLPENKSLRLLLRKKAERFKGMHSTFDVLWQRLNSEGA